MPESLGVAEPPAVSVGSVSKRLLHGSAWVFGGKVGTILLSLLLNMLLARLLPPTELGVYFTTFTLVMIGGTVAQLGLDRAVVRVVSEAIAIGYPGRARRAIRRTFVIGTLGACGMGLALALGLGDWLARHVYHSEVIAGLVPLAAGWLVVTALQSLVVETFRGLQRFSFSTIFDAFLVDVLAASVFGALFIAHARTDARAIVGLSAGFTGTVTLIGGGLLLGRVRRLQGEDDGRRLGAYVAAIAWPMFVTNIAIYLLGTGADLWVLGAFRPQADVAVYGAASRLMLLVGTPLTILQGVTPPIISELHAQGKRQQLQEAMRAVATLAGFPAFVVLVVFILAGSSVMGLLFGPFYRQGATVLLILSVSRLVAVWTGSCGVTLMMTGHQRAMMYITILCGTASLMAGIVAAPRFGAVGVAAATASAQVMQNMLQLVFARRLVGVWTYAQFSPKPLIRFFRPPDRRRSP